MAESNDTLKNNVEALEWLFDDAFYIVKTDDGKKEVNLDEKKDTSDQVIVTETETPTEKKKEKMSIPCMVFHPGANPANSRELNDLWRKILMAVNLTPNGVNSVELQPGISVDDILEGRSGTPIIFWTGEDKIAELEGFPSYEVHENEDVSFVIADPIAQIAKNRDLKVKLWGILQGMSFSSEE